MSGLPCSPHLSPHPLDPLSLSSPFSLLWPILLSFPVAPFSVPVCLSLQELPPSSVYQPWGSGTPGALTSATAPPPGSTRWPRRYQQKLPLPVRRTCSHSRPWVPGHRAQWGQWNNWGDKQGSTPWPAEGAEIDGEGEGRQGEGAAERGMRGAEQAGRVKREAKRSLTEPGHPTPVSHRSRAGRTQPTLPASWPATPGAPSMRVMCPPL